MQEQIPSSSTRWKFWSLCNNQVKVYAKYLKALVNARTAPNDGYRQQKVMAEIVLAELAAAPSIGQLVRLDAQLRATAAVSRAGSRSRADLVKKAKDILEVLAASPRPGRVQVRAIHDRITATQKELKLAHYVVIY
eukprot:137301_1